MKNTQKLLNTTQKKKKKKKEREREIGKVFNMI